MTEDRQKEYARLLREGNTREATELVSDNSQNQEKEDEEVVEEVDETQEDGQAVSEEERFAELSGVGPELADELVEEFGSYDEFAENASPEDLEPISGIGEKRAESLVEQAE